MTLTSLLPLSDPKRFSKATPNLIVDAVRRLWDPEVGVTPKPTRIIQDIKRLKENLKIVFEANGGVVLGVVDRNGHRRKSGPGRQYQPRIANRKALSIEELGLHMDCQQAVRKIDELEWELYNSSQQD